MTPHHFNSDSTNSTLKQPDKINKIIVITFWLSMALILIGMIAGWKSIGVSMLFLFIAIISLIISIVSYFVPNKLLFWRKNLYEKKDAQARAVRVYVICSIACMFFFIGYMPKDEIKQDYKTDSFNSGSAKQEIEYNIKTSQTLNAYLMSQDFVKRKLKSPASADFPFGSEEFSSYVGDSVFLVKSYVDAQNSFGAMLRSNYSARLKYEGGENWKLLNIKLEQQ